MAFDTKQGTHGGRPMQLGPVGRFVMRGMTKIHRRQGYRFQGFDVLILHTVGKQSGEPRVAPVGWFPDGDDGWLIVASAAGSVTNPAWYYNIGAHPDQVTVELKDRKLKVKPEQLEGDARAAAWARITEQVPKFADYQAKTDRTLPVIRLTPA